jgi:SAM-dependent methyltransferase
MLEDLKERVPVGVRSPVSRLYIAGRQLVRQGRARALYAGDDVRCPCCGSAFREFAPLGRPNRLCWTCGSLERDRLLWLLFDRRAELLRPGMRILHVAPERALRGRLRAVAGAAYVGGDLDARYAEHRLDVTALEFPDESFDAVLCNHVLEHVPDDRRALRELHRVLRTGGWATLLVPLADRARTDEDPAVADRGERVRRFGQHDHVRLYGRDYIDRVEEAGLRVDREELDRRVDDEADRRFRLRDPLTDRLVLCRRGAAAG